MMAVFLRLYHLRLEESVGYCTYAIPGISSNATLWEYGHETAGGGGFRKRRRLVGPRLSFDTSDGSEVKSV
jgi:hypothetical protein